MAETPDDNFDRLFEMAIREDQGDDGDVTSLAIFGDEWAEAFIVSRQDAVLAGLEQAMAVFRRVDPRVELSAGAADGAAVAAGDRVLAMRGPVRSLLGAERVALNFMAYLSGIATETRRHVELAAGLGSTVILDTRKTLPGYRALAKRAVRLGGGTNHRIGLYDMVMIKDNHIDAAGGIAPAVAKVRAAYGKRFKIEVECRNLADVGLALDLAVDVIMLDNMDEAACAQAVELRRSAHPDSPSRFEASGDMNPEKLRRFAGLGLDFISIGRLTHSVTQVNFSMQMKLGR